MARGSSKTTKKSTKSKKKILACVSMVNVINRGVDVADLFEPILSDYHEQMCNIAKDNMNWLLEGKRKLRQICEETGLEKAIPKTPKRGAFAKLKDTVEMFESFNNICIKEEENQTSGDMTAAIGRPLPLDDDVFEDENAVPERRDENVMRMNKSPTREPKTPKQRAMEVKEEVMSAEAPHHSTRSRARTPCIATESTPSRQKVVKTQSPVQRVLRSTQRQLVSQKDSNVSEELKPKKNLGTPSRKIHSSPARNVAKVEQKTRGVKPCPSPLKATANKNTEKAAEEIRLKLLAKEEQARFNRNEQLKDRAERVKRDREERELKVKRNKEEEQKEREKKLKIIKDKDEALKEMRIRQAASPSRLIKTPTRANIHQILLGEPGSAVRSLNKRALNSPLTPKVPSKIHRIGSVRKGPISMDLDDSSESTREEERLKAERAEAERKRRQQEEHERMRKMKEEEERVARLKEENARRDDEKRRREEERRRLEEETRRREEEEVERRRMKEEERRAQEEKENVAAITPSAPIVNRHLANVSHNASFLDRSAYEMTPDKVYIPASDTNYGVDDLSSGDETDNEDNPRKKVPKWATHPHLSRTLARIHANPPFDVDSFFGAILEPNLESIFGSSNRNHKRTSSAMWNSPLWNPTKGKSRFFSHQQ